MTNELYYPPYKVLEIWLLGLVFCEMGIKYENAIDVEIERNLPVISPRKLPKVLENRVTLCQKEDRNFVKNIWPEDGKDTKVTDFSFKDVFGIQRLFDLTSRSDNKQQLLIRPRIIANYILWELKNLYPKYLPSDLKRSINTLYNSFIKERDTQQRRDNAINSIISSHFNNQRTIFSEILEEFESQVIFFRTHEAFKNLDKYFESHQQLPEKSTPQTIFPGIINVRELLMNKRELSIEEIRSYYRADDMNGLQWQGIVNNLAIPNEQLLQESEYLIQKASTLPHSSITMAIVGNSGMGKSVQMRLLAKQLVDNIAFDNSSILWIDFGDRDVLGGLRMLALNIENNTYNDNHYIIFIDNFTNEISEEIRDFIGKELFISILANKKCRLIFSAHNPHDISQCFNKSSTQQMVIKPVTSYKTPSQIQEIAKHIISRIKIENRALPHKKYDTVQSLGFRTQSDEEEVKILIVSYLLSRIDVVDFDYSDINIQMLELLKQDLKDFEDIKPLENSSLGKGFRDAFLFMCYMITKNVDTFNANHFLKLSDAINEQKYGVKTNNYFELTIANDQILEQIVGEDRQVRNTQDSHWGLLKFYLRSWPHDNKKSRYDIMSILHPALADVILQAAHLSNISCNSFWAKEYFDYYLRLFKESETASYMVRYCRELYSIKNEDQIFELVTRLLNAGNTHHAYISILLKDDKIFIKQQEHNAIAKLPFRKSADNYFEKTKEIIEKYIKNTNGSNTHFVFSLLGWISSSLFDTKSREKWCSELKKKSPNNLEFHKTIDKYLFNRDKSNDVQQKIKKLYPKNPEIFNELQSLHGSQDNEKAARLLLDDLDSLLNLFKRMPTRVAQIYDKTTIANILYKHLFVGECERIYELLYQSEEYKVISLLKNILFYSNAEREFIQIKKLIQSELSFAFKQNLIRSNINTKDGLHLLLELIKQSKIIAQTHFLKYSKSYTELIPLFKEIIISTRSQQSISSILVWSYAACTLLDIFEPLLFDVILDVFTNIIKNHASFKKHKSFRVPIIPIEDIATKLNFNNHKKYIDFKKAILNPNAVYAIGTDTIKEMMKLDWFSDDLLRNWVTTIEEVLKESVHFPNSDNLFEKWIILKRRLHFSQTDENFISYFIEQHQGVDISLRTFYLIQIAETYNLKKEVRENISLALGKSNNYLKIEQAFAISAFRFDNKPIAIRNMITRHCSNITERYYECKREGDQHFINKILTAGLYELEESHTLAKNIIELTRNDFKEGNFFAKISSVTLKCLIAGLIKTTENTKTQLINDLAAIILPNAVALLDSHLYNTNRDNCHEIIYLLLSTNSINLKVKAMASKRIIAFLGDPKCDKNYPKIVSICKQIIPEKK